MLSYLLKLLTFHFLVELLVGIVNLDRGDIVRHKLVTRIVNAYEQFDKEMKE